MYNQYGIECYRLSSGDIAVYYSSNVSMQLHVIVNKVDITEYVNQEDYHSGIDVHVVIERAYNLYKLNDASPAPTIPEDKALCAKYCLKLMDDDFIPFEYVSDVVLGAALGVPEETATELTNKVNSDGFCVAGVYDNYEIASMFASIVGSSNEQFGFELRTVIEPIYPPSMSMMIDILQKEELL